jgi:co-chaperonin GroES (HSP10)
LVMIMTIDNVSDVKVCGHRVLLDPDFVKEETEWGFKLDVGETYKRERAATNEGKVVDIGPMAWKAFDGDKPDWKPWAKVGDIVIFAKYGGKFIKVKDKDYIICNDEDIQAVIGHIDGEDHE